jgi:hypothetical protein
MAQVNDNERPYSRGGSPRVTIAHVSASTSSKWNAISPITGTAWLSMKYGLRESGVGCGGSRNRLSKQQDRLPNQQIRLPNRQIRLPEQQIRLLNQQIRLHQRQIRLPEQQIRLPERQICLQKSGFVCSKSRFVCKKAGSSARQQDRLPTQQDPSASDPGVLNFLTCERLPRRRSSRRTEDWSIARKGHHRARR